MIDASAGPVRVLHVDDEPDFAEMAAELLARQSDRIDVETARSASEALDRLHETDFDCVVSDFDMPGPDGIEFLEAVRGDYPDLPFILYTGKGSEEVASDAISAGVTEYLQKERGTSQYAVLANRILNAVEKHRTQHELRDREHRLNLFFEQSPLGVIRWDDEFNFARVNDTAREILGYDEGELEGEPWEVVVPEADRGEIGQVVVADLLDDTGGYHSINENVRKDGERIVCEWHNWVVTDDDDDVIAVFSQFQDITERETREQELQEAKSRLEAASAEKSRQNRAFESFLDIVSDSERSFDQQMADVLALGVAFLDLDIGILSQIDPPDYNVQHVVSPDAAIERGDRFDLSDTFCELVYEADGSVGFHSPADGDVEHHPAYRELGLEAYLGEPLVVDGERYGTLNFSSSTSRPEPFTDGERAFVRTLANAVASRVENQRTVAELEQTQDELHRIHDLVPVMITRKDTENRLVRVNAAVTEYLGRPREEIEGKTASELFPETGDAFSEMDRRVIETGEPIRGEIQRLPTPSGEERWMKTDAFPYENANGEVEGVLVVSEDITELKERERELARQNERLSAFSAVVSHDLRNPLNVAQGRLELAREAGESEHLAAVEDAHERIEVLIERLLTLAREGEAVTDIGPVDLSAQVAASWGNVETDDASLVTEVDRTIRADESGLKQVFENLFRNAIEHGGRDVTVTVGELADGFFLEDDGAGIPARDRDEVFEAGYTTSPEGTGFGLGIVRDIVEAHGWQIAVTDQAEGGTRFEVSGIESEP
jgi:PAS domain S-box-containing protein